MQEVRKIAEIESELPNVLHFKAPSRNQLTSRSMIVPKFDYYSAVFNGCTIREIAKLFQLDGDLTEFLGKALRVPTAQMLYFCYKWNHIKFFVPYMSLLQCKNVCDFAEEDIFNQKFDDIKLDISGEGLDFLRSRLQDRGSSPFFLDHQLRRRLYLGEGKDYHLTRLDIAFDLIDYAPSFLSDCLVFCQEVKNSKDNHGKYIKRISCGGLSSGLKFSTNDGSDQSTLWLGTTTSDNLLRIYDKRMEFSDEVGGWKKPCPYGDHVESWIRVEVQLRREKANKFLYASPDYDDKDYFLGIFHWIYQRYAFCDKDYSKTSPCSDVTAFWCDLFNWADISRIIQIGHFVQDDVPYSEKVTAAVENQYLSMFVSYFAWYGVVEGLRRINLRLKSISEGRTSNNPDLMLDYSLRYGHLLSKLQQLGDLVNLPGLTVDESQNLRLNVPDFIDENGVLISA